MAVVSATVTLPIPLFSEVDDIRQLQVFQVFNHCFYAFVMDRYIAAELLLPFMFGVGVFSSVLVAANCV